MRALGYAIIACIVGLAVFFLVSQMRHVRAMPPYKYRCALRDYPFRTGDLIITSAKAGVDDPENTRRQKRRLEPSAIIKMFTSSPFNHTGVVYVDPLTGQVYVWELNGSGTRLATMEEMTCGTPDHYIHVRPINLDIPGEAMEAVIQQQWNYRFNYDIFLAWYHRFYPLVPFVKGHSWGKYKQRTCAHATTECYRMLGVLDFEHTGVDPASVFAPDYAKENPNLPMSHGVAFGPIVRLDFDVGEKVSNKGRRP